MVKAIQNSDNSKFIKKLRSNVETLKHPKLNMPTIMSDLKVRWLHSSLFGDGKPNLFQARNFYVLLRSEINKSRLSLLLKTHLSQLKVYFSAEFRLLHPKQGYDRQVFQVITKSTPRRLEIGNERHYIAVRLTKAQN